MTQAEPAHGYNYDIQSPITAHEGLAAAQFAEHFVTVDGPVLNVAAGKTDLHEDLLRRGHDIPVTSLDPSYSDDALRQIDGRVQGVAQDLPYEDETFALTLCQFGLQHMDEAGAPQAIREMVRVTQTADDVQDESKGTILLGPVFKKGQRALTEGIIKNFADVAGIEMPPHEVKAREGARATMIIKKTPALTEERLEGLIGLIHETGAFKSTRRSLGEFASRTFKIGLSTR